MIRFTVPGRCVPAPRMTRYSKRAPRTMRYMSYRNDVGWCAKAQKVPRLSGTVVFRATVYLVKRSEGDVDNYAKTLKDALNKIAWDDDRQVIDSHVRKVYVKTCNEERVEIEIREAAG